MTLSMVSPIGKGSAAQEALRAGDLKATLALLQDQVRAEPANARLRIFLFQLLAVTGAWDRAMNQLKVIGELDASALPMVQTCRELIPAESFREAVFAGKKVPLLFGEPEAWVALLVDALLRDGRGETADATRLRAQALDDAPAVSGTADGQVFAWIADADSRLGPVVEAVIQGRYYWVPFNRLSALTLEAPVDLRDCVWTPAHFTFTNGGDSVGFIPSRYPGSHLVGGATALARRTDWAEPSPGNFVGSGQRMWNTDAADLPLMDLRVLSFDAPNV